MWIYNTALNQRLGRKRPSVLESAITVIEQEKPNLLKTYFNSKTINFNRP